MNDLWTLGHKVELDEMLKGRETRAALQKQMLSFCPGCSLICFTLNIAGPIKVNALTDEAFYGGCEMIESMLMSSGISAEAEIAEHEYGHEAYYIVDEEEESAEGLKQLMVMIEDDHLIGRLFDIDVIRQDGSKVSRIDIGYEPRRCLICDKPASECASIRNHSVEELKGRTYEMICDYLKSIMPQSCISRLAYASMMNEIATTPKPGLVDLSNNGSHKDMTPETFELSAQEIKQYFSDCFYEGLKSKMAEDVLPRIRPLGIAAEKRMLEATGGVNTHKGLIFSLGIICAACGFLRDKEDTDICHILDVAGQIAAGAADEKPLRVAAGTGARAEAASGFASLSGVALPAYEYAINGGVDINCAGVYTLLLLIANANDSNMIYRAGEDKALKLKEKAAALAAEFKGVIDNAAGSNEALEIGSALFLKKVSDLDEEFISVNASPGGCADLLAITYFLEMYKEI